MVPDNFTFTMQDVCDEMNLSYAGRTLQNLFNNANDNGFDPAYVGNKDRLTNFRNYDHNPGVPFLTITPDTYQFGYDGGSKTFVVSTNDGTYTIGPTPIWLGTSNVTSTSFNIICSTNSSSSQRSGTVTISTNNLFTNISIGQQGFCLVKGTKIRLYNNQSVNIEELIKGDTLLSSKIDSFKDTNDTRELYKWRSKELKVTNVTSNIKSIIEIKDQDTIIINKGLLEATSLHNQLIKRNDKWMFVPFKELLVGDLLYRRDGKLIEIDSLTKGINTVYKLSLESPYHTFYGNDILTHNIK